MTDLELAPEHVYPGMAVIANWHREMHRMADHLLKAVIHLHPTPTMPRPTSRWGRSGHLNAHPDKAVRYSGRGTTPNRSDPSARQLWSHELGAGVWFGGSLEWEDVVQVQGRVIVE